MPASDSLLTMAKQYAVAITDQQVSELAVALGVTARSLRRLRVGWCERSAAFSFPMRNAKGSIVGIRLRHAKSGAKFAETGGHDGLFIPTGLSGEGALVICEGPTDCCAVLDMGFDAIGRGNNNSRQSEEYITAFLTANPREEMWIVHDVDPSGSRAATQTVKAADRLASRLVPVVGAVRVFSPPAPYKDVRAWRNAGATMDDVDIAAYQAPSRGPSAELGAVLEAEISGQRQAIEWPWRFLTKGAQALIPGTVTIIAGESGATKSLWVLQALAHWFDLGIPFAIYELEESRHYHLRRALAQRVGASWLTNLNMVHERPDETRAIHFEHSAWEDRFARQIYDAPDKPVMLLSLVAWIEARLIEGARIVIVDPITAAVTSDMPWEDAQRFMQTVKPLLDRYGASLILLSHRKSGNRRMPATLDDLAGGSAWQRFSQCILWIERHDNPKTVTLRRFEDYSLTDLDQITHTVRIMKCRNGIGAGWHLGYSFDPQTLRLDERGVIVRTQRQSASC
ncbi:MAG: AAA family ATPase [Planctomycetes bacterium]|nr:AAA family ATPase [Planctomycetota bacterium]